MEKELRETLRYLGYRGRTEQEPETGRQQMLALAEDCLREARQAARPRCLWKEQPLQFLEGGRLDLGLFQTRSQALAKSLKDCTGVLFFAATLGAETDRLLGRYGRLQVSRAVVLQAAAAAVLEAYCDQVFEEKKKEYESRGQFLRPRFSPGYGDFSLECQPALLAGLEAGKRIGITLTGRYLMAPSKSVTAAAGISLVPAGCVTEGCEACGKTDCAYRRDEA